MKPNTPTPKFKSGPFPKPTRSARTLSTDIGIMVEQIRSATEYLISEHDYSLDNLRNLSGGGDRNGKGGHKKERLHKNSIMKIRDLRLGYTVRMLKPGASKKRHHWVEAATNTRGDDGQKGRDQWLWNPQVDTLEKLERIVLEAVKLGFKPAMTRRITPEWAAQSAEHDAQAA